jgi:catechol 2,3-dioxygenase-like lactoylglutathione lyase family enzyme
MSRHLMEGLIPSIPVQDINRSVEFYQRVLGFELVRITGKDEVTRAFLRAGHVRLILRSGTREALIDYRSVSLDDRIVLHLPIRNVQALYDRVRQHEAKIIQEMELRLFGVQDFTIEDADGILLTFSELPG